MNSKNTPLTIAAGAEKELDQKKILPPDCDPLLSVPQTTEETVEIHTVCIR